MSYNFNQISFDQSKQTAFYEDIHDILNEDKNPDNKWNIYYYKRYKAENSLLYFIMIICIIIIILSSIHKNFKFFDTYSYSTIVAIILAISIIYIIKQILDIMFRDKQNFDEYNYLYNASDINTGDVDSNKCAVKVPDVSLNMTNFNTSNLGF